MKFCKNGKKKRVVIALDLAKTSRRDFLSGLFDQCNKSADWSIRILQSAMELTPEAVRGWAAAGIDGAIIAEDGMPGTEEALASSGIPAVVVGSRNNWLRNRKTNVVFLRIDDEMIGRYAADRLSELGAFNSAVFLPAAATDFWSELRGLGFCAGFARRGIAARIYREEADGALEAFLETIPKPAAVFAACDRIAYMAIAAMRRPDDLVPGKIALLGVDNDELLCNSTRPRLSSIRPDHYAEGAIAQRELESLMRARKPRRARTLLCGDMKLVGRESTEPIAPVARLMTRALEFIGRQAIHGIGPDDVAAHLGISRRLLDLRFHELHSTTVARAILDAKLEAVKRLLSETDEYIVTISRKCGFPNPNHLKNVFTAKFGVTMREWRRQNRAAAR